MSAEGARTFDDITARLDEIVSTVRSKDTSLERSLDLFDEAIRLGSEAVDMVDKFELSPRETELLDRDGAGTGEGPGAPQVNSSSVSASAGASADPADAPV